MKTVNICLEVNDTDDAIRVLNDINQLLVGELKSFNIYEAYEFNRGTYGSVLAERQLNEAKFEINNKDLSRKVLEAEELSRKILESKGVK